MQMIRGFKNLDKALLGAVCGALVLGLLAIASADMSRGDEFFLLKRQMLSAVIGIAFLIIITRASPEFFRVTSRAWYVVGLALLIAVLFFGQTIRGTRGWFEFGGFSFQPVEFMKVALVMTLARIVDRRGRAFRTALFFFGTGIVALIPAVLVLLQPDLGSSLLLLAIWFVLIMFIGSKRRYILLVIGGAIVACVTAWFLLLQPYQKERILSFVEPTRDPQGAGYNVQQSIIAIGSGKWFGRGLGFGSQNQLRFLPEGQTDFIFAVIGEELGFVGATALIACFIIIGWRMLALAAHCRDDFTLSLVIGIFAVWSVQVFVNIGSTLGLVPVTGITLPFVSYGGSSLVMNFVLLGLAQSVARNQVSA